MKRAPIARDRNCGRTRLLSGEWGFRKVVAEIATAIALDIVAVRKQQAIYGGSQLSLSQFGD